MVELVWKAIFKGTMHTECLRNRFCQQWELNPRHMNLNLSLNAYVFFLHQRLYSRLIM